MRRKRLWFLVAQVDLHRHSLYLKGTIMEFGIHLILPVPTMQSEEIRLPGWDKTSELIDDDPHRPLFLVKAGDIFMANGVRFEISGFFAEPLPTSTDGSFVEFMEQLP